MATKAPKAPKPYEVSLWNTRLQLDPSTSMQRAREIAPYSEAAGTAATGIISRLTGGPGKLYGQLESQASDELAMGGGLNADEIRAATQGARAGFSARGLTSGPQSVLAEVLSRATYANARRRERQGFAASVEGLRQQQQGLDTSTLGQLSGASLGGYGMAEAQRQFELERGDTLMNNDKRAALDLKIGKDNAAAQQSAARKSTTGGILGGVLGIASKFI